MRQKYMIPMVVLGLLLLVLQVGPAAAAAPAPPSNFSATVTPGPTTDSVTLTWSASGTFTKFTIQRVSFESGKATYSVLGTARSYKQTGLVRNSTYRYRINATSSTGTSVWSTVLEVNTP